MNEAGQIPPDFPPASPGSAYARASQESARIARGLAVMVASQMVTAPLSVVVSAVLGRRLGPSDFGAMYLAQTVVGLGFLVVEWGQSTWMAGAVARDRSLAEPLLGTSLILKVAMGALATGFLLAAGSAQGYSPVEQGAVALLSLAALAGSLQASFLAVLRGYERNAQVSALGFFGNLLGSLLVIVFALAGWGLTGVLWACVVAAAVPAVASAVLLRRTGVGLPRMERGMVRTLFGQGSAILLLTAILALQPYIDTAFLARLAPAEVMGWHGATRRIASVLFFPATTLGFTTFPTLARLHREAPEREIELMRSALRVMVLAGVPAAVGTVLFARPVVETIYGAGRFEGAVLVLQTLAPWVLLVHFGILLGSELVAAGRALAWSLVQMLCLVVSLLADAPLIHLCGDRLANGAVGISLTSGISELLMVAIGAALIPREMLRGGLGRTIVQTAAAAAAMAAAALGLGSAPAPVSAAASLAAYLAVLWALGGVSAEDARRVIGLVRARAAAR